MDSNITAQTQTSEIHTKSVLAAIACALCMSVGPAVLLMGTFPLFFQPVSHQFGWGAALFPQALLVSGTVGALVGPFAGGLIDRRGVRAVLIPALVLWALSLAALSFVNGSPLRLSPLRLYIICTIMGVTAATCGPVALAKVVSGWFDRTRGVVMGIVLSAAPAAATALALFATRLSIAKVGWQTSYQLCGLAVLVIALPVAVLFMREAPAVDAARTSENHVRLPGMNLMGAIRTRAFWTLMIVSCSCCAIAMGLNGHMMAWSNERGIDAGLTTLALSAYSLVGPFGSLFAGWVADRFDNPKPLFGFFALPFLGIFALLIGGTAMWLPGMILLGLGFATAAGLTPYLVTRYFGVGYASEILGVTIGALQLSMGVGPVLIGVAHDKFGAYGGVVQTLALLAAGAAALSLTLPKYNLPSGEMPVADPVLERKLSA